jgi:hypothetical protein
MNIELGNRLLALSLTEKIEVYRYLMPFVTPDFDEAKISPKLLAELEQQLHEDRANPEPRLSFEDFKHHWSQRTHS